VEPYPDQAFGVTSGFASPEARYERRESLELAGRYCDAVERADVGALAGMLTEDAIWAMPPILTWYRGRPAIAVFLRDYAYNESWRQVATRANGQLAVGRYTFDARQRRWVASVFDVLTLDGDHIAQVTGFVTAELLSRWARRTTASSVRQPFPASAFPPCSRTDRIQRSPIGSRVPGGQ
jgi:hypothetical protein